MKELRLLVWLTHLGLSVAVPPVLLILLALWLRDDRGWGGWVVWAGVALGVVMAIDGLRTSLKAMSRMSCDKKEAPHHTIPDNDPN